MRIVEQSAKLVDEINEKEVIEKIESAGRVCYKSEWNQSKGSAQKFVEGIIARGHLSVLEHVSLTFKIITDRGVSHELVRHRLASYSQESTRYVRYDDVEFIEPEDMSEQQQSWWLGSMSCCESNYKGMLDSGCKPEIARSVLPNSVKTELYMTANLREWLHFLELRTSNKAHPQMRSLAKKIQDILVSKFPIIFKRRD